MTIGKHREGKLDKYHSVDILGIRETKYVNPDTGKKVGKGYGWTFKESDKNARRDSSRGGGSSGGGSSSGGSCCYITTACLDALGLPRNSLEMQAMKVLTRGYILKSFSGKREYVQYGRKAPGIVQAINSREDALSIWERVYEKVREVTTSVLSGNYAKGHQQYKDLVLGLEEKFAKAS